VLSKAFTSRAGKPEEQKQERMPFLRWGGFGIYLPLNCFGTMFARWPGDKSWHPFL
jgi:hypothetical protein